MHQNRRLSNYPRVCALLAVLPLASTPALPQVGVAAAPTPAEAQSQVLRLVEQGREALLADNYEEAGKALEAAFRAPGFRRVSPGLQYHALLFAGLAASGREDYLGAHEYLMAATEFDAAGSDEWLLRARYAAAIEAWPDAGLSITTIAKRWPKTLAAADLDELLGMTRHQLWRDATRRREYLELVNALFDAKYRQSLGIEPDGAWADLILDALERKDTKRAREVAARLENTDTLLHMRIDRRYDVIVAAEPRRFDIAAAAKRHSKFLARAVSRHPRLLEAWVQYAYALLDEGRYQEVLRESDALLQRISSAPKDAPPYDDIDDNLNWVYNHKAAALRALERWDEALAVMESGRRKLEDGSANVSQAINLGFHYNDAGQPQKALDALADVDWARSLSPYGRMQLQHVRYRAYLQLGKRTEADEVLAYLRQHHDDAQDTWLLATLDSGDIDGAAALLISQLRDPSKRRAALGSVQEYLPTPALPRMREGRDRWRALLARADVAAAIDEVGRREKMPIYRTPD